MSAKTTEKTPNIQDLFLNTLRKDKSPVVVFILNCVNWQCTVTWFDNFSMLLRRDDNSQLVYKHAISTVMPLNPFALNGSSEEEND